MYSKLIIFTLILFSPTVQTYAGIDATAIMKQISLFGAFESVSAEFRMTIERTNGSKERSIELFYRRQVGANDVLARVVAPAFLQNLKFLRRETNTGAVELYMRNSQGTRRVLGDRGDEALFDSDFRTADFMASPTSQATLLEESVETITLETRLNLAGTITIRRMLLRKSDFFLLSFEEFDVNGTMTRRYSVTSFDVANGYVYAKKSVMEVPSSGQRTVLEVKKITPNPKLGDALFSRMNL